MAFSRVYTALFFCVFAIISSCVSISSATEAEKEYVLTLDHSNFTEVVSKHKFIVVEFYAPWYKSIYLIYLSFTVCYDSINLF